MNGPIQTPLENESEKIRRAPAYDVDKARKLLDMLPKVCAALDALPPCRELTTFGHTFSADGYRRLEAEIRALESIGGKVSVLMIDVATLSGVAYNVQQTFCSQSTIKAFSVGAILEDNYAALLENGQLMRDAIVVSSNDAYEEIYKIYGNRAVKNWARDVGVDPYYVNIRYPRLLTSRDNVKLWTKLYAFLNGEKDVSNFAGYYADSLASATSIVLGEKIPVQTKAGWEDNPQHSPHDECSCHDSGIVYAPNGVYLFAVFTGIPYEVPAVNPLRKAAEILYKLHAEI